MRTHTNEFKQKIKLFGRQIKGKIICYPNYDLVSEDGNNILTEDNLQLVSEQTNFNEYNEIDEENIFSISIIKNGNLFQSLMKEFDFEAKDELNIGSIVNPHFGLLINDNNMQYEYLDYGNYVVYSKEYNMDSETWNYICYDKMLFSMIKYTPLRGVNFPITIKEYIDLICNKAGLEFEDSQFVNQNELIYEDLYKDKGLTYRDVLDEISKIIGGNLLINDNDKIAVAYPNETNDTINEEYLKDINAKISEKNGIINSIAILDSNNNLQFIAEDTQSINENGMTRISITDNLIAQNGETQTIADNILNKLNGLYYYINDFTTAGVCYYDFLDLFNVEVGGNVYKCLLLNNEITINQGIEEHIFTEKIKESKKSSNEFVTSVMSNKQVQFKINQQDSKIESRVEKNGIISAINQSPEEIQINANKISLEGKIIDLTSDDIVIESKNFRVNKEGQLTCNSANLINAIFSVSDASESGSYISMDSGNLFEGKITTNLHNGIMELENNTTGGSGLFIEPQIRLYWGISEKTTIIGAAGCYSPLFSQNSHISKKKNIEKLENAMQLVEKTNVYKYNWKNENDKLKKHIGLIIGDGYNTPNEIIDEKGTGIDTYAMLSVLWKAIQEQQQEINKLKEMITNGKH